MTRPAVGIQVRYKSRINSVMVVLWGAGRLIAQSVQHCYKLLKLQKSYRIHTALALGFRSTDVSEVKGALKA
ncbi:hypothetical protein RRG08_025255 [Elysia crispata]|uniref:Uncharacterized protein n=1 Tax=Elysia crispata TaxID=231223 RepID=A0AAE1ACB1_9GAST|nr:hypothetical protein RRG08_025255 [Elysia crispata]